MKLSQRQKELIVAALRGAILDLKIDRLRAQRHGAVVTSYTKEIEEFNQLKEYIENGSLQDGQTRN